MIPFDRQHASIFPPQIHQNPQQIRSQEASKKRLILGSFFRAIKTAQDGPKTAQDGDPSAKTAPRGSQDGPKRPQTKHDAGVSFRSWPPRAAKTPQDPPKTPPRPIFDRFLVDFWLIFGRFLIHFSVDFLLIDFFSSSLFYFQLF